MRLAAARAFCSCACSIASSSFSAVSLVFLLMGISWPHVFFYTVLTVFSWGMSFVAGQWLGHFARN